METSPLANAALLSDSITANAAITTEASPADDPEKEAATDLITNPKNVARVLRRLHASEGTLMFPTVDGDMKVVIRSDGDSDESAMVFDLGFIVSEDAVRMEHEGSLDETGVYIHQIISVDEDPEDEDFVYIQKIMNDAFRTKICECGERIIWDGHDICTMCDLCTDGVWSDQTCVICTEPIRTKKRGSVSMKCCGQTMHKSCRARYESDTKNTCPICRK